MLYFYRESHHSFREFRLVVAYAGDGLVAIVVRGKVVGGEKKNHTKHITQILSYF